MNAYISQSTMSQKLILIFGVLLTLPALNGCTPTTQSQWQGPTARQSTVLAPQQEQSILPAKPVKVALLVPLTGNGSNIGQAILNASQLALFDMGPQEFQLIPRDTKGTPAGTQIATQEAINNGASLILGPLFSNSVKSAAAAAAPHGINVIGFTTDQNAVSYNSFAMGFLANTQVESVLTYAINQHRGRFTVVTKDNQYGTLVTNTAQQFLSKARYPAPHIHKINGNNLDLNKLYSDLIAHQSQAILLAVDMATATSISNHLISKGLSNQALQRLGLGLWDNNQRAYSSALDGAWYAAPSPMQRDRFNLLYKDTYGMSPPRLASIGYDATALAISLHKRGSDYSKATMIRANGFYGLDGIFRFRPNGLVERGLAIMEFSRGRSVVRRNAPTGFQ